ncbi:nucleotidyltransferase family protein [Clostridium perfringens]|nr:nucleotidyltransferase family protein [Clostridium perfringens]
MNKHQEQTLNLLNLAIHGKKFTNLEEILDWNEVIKEGKAHEVSAIIYSSIYGVKELKGLNQKDLGEWKKSTFITGISQISHFNQVGKIFEIFNRNEIDVIALKGLVVRNLYPKVEFRTMGDADILVHEKDLEKVKELLFAEGYELKEGADNHGAHLAFSHKKFWPIEVHWTLVNDDYFSVDKSFEKALWKNAVEVKIGNSRVLSLGNEDLALHLCLHMGGHIIYGGFGLRQLCDLVLLVEKKGDSIDWSSFVLKVNGCGAESFVYAIFKCCNKLFNMSIPLEIEELNKVDNQIINKLIENIFNSGVFGRKDAALALATGFSRNKKGDEDKSPEKKYFELLFPKVENMSEKYDYAKKNKALTPVAWVHHLGAGVVNKNFSMGNKIKIISNGIKISKKKRKLLEELELIKK